MIVYDPPGELKIPRSSRIRKRELTDFLAAAAERIPLRGAVSVLITGDARMRELNRQFRKKDKATDVLSFPHAAESLTPGADGKMFAGDLAISLETACRQAEERGHSLETELRILLLHGLLHLAGYDHEADSGQMLRRERRLRRELGLPLGLIERSTPRAANPKVDTRNSGSSRQRVRLQKPAGRRA